MKKKNKCQGQTLKGFKNFDDLLKKKFTKEELAAIDREVELEANALRALYNKKKITKNYPNQP